MAIVTYPLNNISYSAEDAELFHCTRTSGVFAADEDFNATVTGTNNVVTIGQGIAWIRNSKFSGKVVANKAAVSVDMGLANGTYNRIDAIVLQFSASGNKTSIIRKQGTASTSPKAPSVTQTESVYELHLYHVYRRAGATSIVEGDITDLRMNRDYCGVMSDDVTMLGDDFISQDMIGVANGVASLNSSGKVPTDQLPSMNYIPTSKRGAANGVAPLNSSRKIDSTYLPTMNYIPTSQKGVANGVASLGSDGKVPSAQLPSMNYIPTSAISLETISVFPGVENLEIKSQNIKLQTIDGVKYLIIAADIKINGNMGTVYISMETEQLTDGSGGVLYFRNSTDMRHGIAPVWVFGQTIAIYTDVVSSKTYHISGIIAIL